MKNKKRFRNEYSELTVSQLFAISRGVAVRKGSNRCFYCLGWCGDNNPAREYVKDSFTGHDSVGGGAWVCDGCVEAMRSKADIVLLDGENRHGQRVWAYSWVVEKNRSRAATKRHRKQLLDICVSPPSLPIAIVLSDSGKKHYLYRSRLAWDATEMIVSLEGELICYKPLDLLSAVALCTEVVSVVGKPALSTRLGMERLAMIAAVRGQDVVDKWMDLEGRPLARLAAWIVPGKAECCDEIETKNER